MSRFLIPRARLSFPHLFEKAEFEGKPTKYEATFLIPKDDEETLALINKEINRALIAKFGSKDKIPAGIKSESKCCFKDGNNIDYDGYAGHMSFKAANDKRPRALDRSKHPLTEDNELLYAGAWVQAVVEPWIQTRSGNRVNGSLFAVRFLEHAPAFGAGSIPEGIEDDFEDLDDEPLEVMEADESLDF